MTVASFIAAQRTDHGVRPREVLPVARVCPSRGSTSGTAGHRLPASSVGPSSTLR